MSSSSTTKLQPGQRSTKADRMNTPYVITSHTENSILQRVRDSKGKLIDSLAYAETADGWNDLTGEAAQSFWTAIEILKSMVESEVFPQNFQSVLLRIKKLEKQVRGLRGWEYEGLANHVSVYITGDVVRLYLALRKFDDLGGIIDTLQKMQNEDGGWGVCDGDITSKVRATSWVLGALLACLNLPPTESLVKPSVIAKGLSWLYHAQNDRNNDYGWGSLPDTLPSNVTATAFALNALLDAVNYCQSHNSVSFPLRIDSINRGLQWLIAMNRDNHWRGTKEEFGIQIDGAFIGRHISGALGTTSVVQVLMKACNAGIIEPGHPIIYNAITELINRCRNYHGVRGIWFVPAEDDGTPVTWNSAFAIDAFKAFENFYLQHLAGHFIEKTTYSRLTRNARFWRQAAILLLITTVGIALAPELRTLGQLPLWFAQLPVLYQGLTMIVVSIVVEQLYSRLIRGVISSLMQKIKGGKTNQEETE